MSSNNNNKHNNTSCSVAIEGIEIPTSFDEDILYKGLVMLHMSMPHNKFNSIWQSDKFWHEFNHRNRCSPKQVASMLAVLFGTKEAREHYCMNIDTANFSYRRQPILTILEQVFIDIRSNCKVPELHCIKNFNNNTNNGKFILQGAYLITVDLNLQHFASKIMHSSWLEKLEQKYLDYCKSEMEGYDSAVVNTHLLWLPECSVFYTVFGRAPLEMEYYKTNEVNERLNFLVWEGLDDDTKLRLAKLQYTMVPLPDTWLKFDMDLLQFDKTGIVAKVSEIVTVTPPDIPQHNYTIYNAVHYSFIHPDVPFVSSKVSKTEDFRELLFAASTFGNKTKQYLPGDTAFLTKQHIQDEDVYVVDIDNVTQPVMFNVQVMENDGSLNFIHTTIKVTKSQDSAFQKSTIEFARMIASRQGNGKGVRTSDGNRGLMHTMGIHRHNAKLKTFSDNKMARTDGYTYTTFIDNLQSQIAYHLPNVLPLAAQHESSRGLTNNLREHPGSMVAQDNFMPCAFTISFDFASAQHTDFRDGSMGVYIFFQDDNTVQVSDGYFLFGNLMAIVDGKIKKGVAVKLVPGLMIAFDGRMIRHGTTRCHHKCPIYGIHTCSNAITMRSVPTGRPIQAAATIDTDIDVTT